MEGAIPNVMDVVHSCRCCLRRAPDKDLMTPYTHLGTTEIYSDMLKECFEIHLLFDSEEEVGICDVCVGRLRDASDFKLQVQRSLVELQAWLQEPLQIKEENCTVESIKEDGAGTSEEPVLYAEVPIKLELRNEDEISDGERQELLDEERAVKAEVSDATSSDEDCIPLAWAAADSGAPSRHGPRLASRMKDMPDDTAGLRAEEQAYTCDNCGEHFTDESRYIHHVQAHYKQFIQKHSLNQHKRIHTGVKLYSCKECNNRFTQKQHLDRPYGCNECNKQFRSKSDLTKHARIHTGVKPFSCKECNKQFRSKSDLNRHARIHTGVKPFSCKECNKQFRSKGDLNRHAGIHTEVKPYSCNECNKQFRSKGNLTDHARTHTGVKPYGCNECNKQFHSKSDLTKHARIHTGVKPYSCKECDKRFTIKQNLVAHRKTHTGEKPYGCNECNKQFRTKGQLIRHIRIHTGVKPYSCKQCDKQFTRKEGLVSHKRIHT